MNRVNSRLEKNATYLYEKEKNGDRNAVLSPNTYIFFCTFCSMTSLVHALFFHINIF